MARFSSNKLSVCRLAFVILALLFFQAVAVAEIPVIRPEKIEEKSADFSINGSGYSINVDVPVFVLVPYVPARDVINAKMRKALTNEIASFKKGLKAKKIKVPSSLIINYEFHLANRQFVSITASVLWFIDGAHPIHYRLPFNYYSANGKEVKLVDLFKVRASQKNWLNQLAKICKAQLLTEGYKSWNLETGAAPKEKNYSLFGITYENLIIYFAEYQVGPYVSGMPEVAIPWEDLGINSPQ